MAKSSDVGLKVDQVIAETSDPLDEDRSMHGT
jgi:hypothetical protein